MSDFSPGTDRLVTFIVRFVCGAFIGWILCALFAYRWILRLFAAENWGGLLILLLVSGGITGLIFGFTSPKDDKQWLE